MPTFNLNVIDNAIPDELRQRVWDYLTTQQWFVPYRGSKPWTQLLFLKKLGTLFYNKPRLYNEGIMMPRCALAPDNITLQERHPLIAELWEQINQALGGDLVIEGHPEGMNIDNMEGWDPTPKVAGLTSGYRVYTNAQPYEKIKRSHGIHRDNPDLKDEKSMSVLCVVNPEWYPSWYAENIFYENDFDGTTNDRQQFQAPSRVAQDRGFNLGWAEQVVSPKPGRIIAYDGRYLHSTKPAAEWAPDMRIVVVFRVRRK